MCVFNILNLNIGNSVYFAAFGITIAAIIIPFLLELINNIVFKESIKEGSYYAYKKFSKEITNTTNNIVRIILDILFLPYEGYKNIDEVIKALNE